MGICAIDDELGGGMNRIIVVGNGFDLAHGIPTSYKNFIEWYWSQRIKLLRTIRSKKNADKLCEFVIKDTSGLHNWMYVFSNYYSQFSKLTASECLEDIRGAKDLFELKLTPFFSRIIDDLNNKGWVDIEWIYYQSLKRVAEGMDSYYNDVSILQDELDFLCEKLVEYLLTLQFSTSVMDEVKDIIFGPICSDDIAVAQNASWARFNFARMDWSAEKWQLLLDSYKSCSSILDKKIDTAQNFLKQIRRVPQEKSDLAYLPQRIMLLNFNYTNLADQYFPANSIFEVNHIHGELSIPKGVIFGYGDDLDDSYSRITKMSDNNMLRNIKSIRYMESDNYRNFLKFIEQDSFQVYVMGHSCGNSDKTLLNTLFEHDNCVSIKPFYYEVEDGNDNYLDIVQNISRSFTDMKKMRDRVVNKKFCKPMPQLKR